MAYSLSQSASARPSDLYNITEPVQAYCFDRAVTLFGTALRAELDGVEGKKKEEIERKRQRILSKWIPEASAGFRDPARRIGLL